jgi:hypothetical protein
VRGLAAAAFIAAAISFKLSARHRGLQAAVLALFVVGPFSECARFASDPAPWQQYSALDHPNGARYAYIESSFLQGQLLAIARVESQRWYGAQYAGLETTNGDSPRSYASIVRPDPLAEPRYGQLHLGADGRVVAVRSRNHAYMVFDPNTDERWSHAKIYELSPFLLLDAQAKPVEHDVKLISYAIADVANRYVGDSTWLPGALEQGTISGIPSAKLLESALQHPNPAVRPIAQQLLTELLTPQRTNSTNRSLKSGCRPMLALDCQHIDDK